MTTARNRLAGVGTRLRRWSMRLAGAREGIPTPPPALPAAPPELWHHARDRAEEADRIRRNGCP